MLKAFFVTGTDTGVGKTLISTVITLAVEGMYWKPVQCGDSDLDCVKRLSGLPQAHFADSVYTLKAPLSPDQAARKENIRIDLSRCQPPVTTRTLIVEGAGGLLVPLNDATCMLDMMQQFALPVIIVSRGTLGTINHTLMTIEILRSRRIPIQGVVFSGELNPDNQLSIEQRGNVKTLFHVPPFEKVTQQTLQAWTASQRQQINEALL